MTSDTTLISVESVLKSQHYEEDEADFVSMLIQGAIAFLKGAGAYDERNELTKTALILIVGCWLENRDGNFTDYKNVRDFPLGIRSIITQLQYTSGGDTIVEKNTSK